LRRVAVSVFELDLKGAVVEEFGSPFASAIPDVGLDDPPAADQAAIGRSLHPEASKSFGNRARL
jgi:hypothetical protein